MPRALRGASSMSVMTAFCGCFGSSSPKKRPVSFSYGCAAFGNGCRCSTVSLTTSALAAAAIASAHMVNDRVRKALAMRQMLRQNHATQLSRRLGCGLRALDLGTGARARVGHARSSDVARRPATPGGLRRPARRCLRAVSGCSCRHTQNVDHIPQVESCAVPASKRRGASCTGERPHVAARHSRRDLEDAPVAAPERQPSESVSFTEMPPSCTSV